MKDNDLKEIQGHLIAKYVAAQLGIKYWQYQLLTSFHFSPLSLLYPSSSGCVCVCVCVCVCLCVCVCVWVSCLTLCDPMDCTLLGSFVHGISEATILEWAAIPFSKLSPYSTLILQPVLLYSPPKNTHHGTDSEKREPCIPHKGCVWENRSATLHWSTAPPLTPPVFLQLLSVPGTALWVRAWTSGFR